MVAILVTASIAAAIFIVPSYLRPRPDFILQPVEASLPIMAGNTREFNVKVSSLNGFTGIVSFSSAATASLSVKLAGTSGPNPVALLGRNDTLFVDVTTSNVGNYTLTVTGISRELSHSITLTVIAQSITFTANPDPIVVSKTTPVSGSITLEGINGFSGNVNLGASYADVSRSVFLPLRGTANATVTTYTAPSNTCPLPTGFVITISAATNAGVVFRNFNTVCV